MKVEDFCTPVELKEVYYKGESNYLPMNEYKGVYTKDHQLISVVKNSYKLESNEEILEKTIGLLDKMGIKYHIDPMNSYSTLKRMTCFTTFPDVKINDGESDIFLTMIIYNSYDMSKARDVCWGTFRLACSNGAIMGFKVLTDIMKRRHSKNSYFGIEEESIDRMFKNFYIIGQRVDYIKTLAITPSNIKDASNILGEKYTKYMNEDNRWKEVKTMYDLYNTMTWYTTHKVYHAHKDGYYNKIAKAFDL